jgi:hypothetical protein
MSARALFLSTPGAAEPRQRPAFHGACEGVITIWIDNQARDAPVVIAPAAMRPGRHLNRARPWPGSAAHAASPWARSDRVWR